MEIWGSIIAALLLLCSQASAEDTVTSDPAAVPALSIASLQVALLSADGSKLLSNTGTYPNQLLTGPQITAEHAIEVTGSVLLGSTAHKPQQAHLVATHRTTGLSAYAIGKPNKKNVHTFSLPASSILQQIGKQAGEYELLLLLGDPAGSKGVHWPLGVVELLLPASDVRPLLRTPRTQPASNQKPVITHVFRQPDSRPPAVISLVFTALVLLPLLGVLAYVLLVLNVNFRAWPKDGLTALMALAFHGLLAAMLGLYLFFWLRWDLAHTLPAALALGALLALTGQQALMGLASARLGAKKD
ncbi:Oligosaccharyltransferase subunit Ribophorin II-domain-containing protein [Haematococcus lacustris]